jgi:hypothetical protein
VVLDVDSGVPQDREYWCVEVRLVRAANVPLAQRYIRANGEVTGAAYASKLIWLRASNPEDLLDRIDGLGLTPAELDTQLAFWADILRTYGQDFLAGDLGVLDQPDPVIRRRRRKKGRR